MFSWEIYEFFMKKAVQLYWKNSPKQMFSSEYCKIFKNTYFEEHLLKATSAF